MMLDVLFPQPGSRQQIQHYDRSIDRVISGKHIFSFASIIEHHLIGFLAVTSGSNCSAASSQSGCPWVDGRTKNRDLVV
jgi:hypothetical protein